MRLYCHGAYTALTVNMCSKINWKLYILTSVLCFKHSTLPSVLCLVYNEVLSFDMHARVPSHPYMWILEGTQHTVQLKTVSKNRQFRHNFIHVRCCIACIRPNIVSTRWRSYATQMSFWLNWFQRNGIHLTQSKIIDAFSSVITTGD